MKEFGFASIPSVLQYLRYAETQHLDTSAAILSARIDQALLKNENGRIRGVQFQDLIAHLMTQANDPLFGFHTGQLVQPGSYSVLGYIVMSSATIGDAIQQIPPFERLVGDMGITTIDKIRDEIYLSWHCAYPNPQVRTQMIDNVLVSWTHYARWLANTDAQPARVLIERPSPGEAFVKEYTRFFQTDVRFGQRQNAIVFPESLLNLPLRQPDKRLLKTLETHAQEQIAELDNQAQRLSIRVSNAIRKQLEMGSVRKELIAAEFNVTERTLQRKLAEEGQSYQGLLDEVRKDQAIHMLKHSDFALQDIAYNLGFSDARSFYRRFKTWTGLTPGEYRKQQKLRIS